jgi:hypothetical protein
LIFGGLDRLLILKKDLANDRCLWIRLVTPADAGNAAFDGVDTPQPWAIEEVSGNDSASSCDDETPAMSGAEAATSATGTITFETVGDFGYPCTVSIDAAIDFAGMLVAPMESMNGNDIMVTGTGGC